MSEVNLKSKGNAMNHYYINIRIIIIDQSCLHYLTFKSILLSPKNPYFTVSKKINKLEKKIVRTLGHNRRIL